MLTFWWLIQWFSTVYHNVYSVDSDSEKYFFHEVELLPTPRDLMLTSRVLQILSLWHYSALWSLFLRFLTDTLPLSVLYVVQISVTVTNNS